MTHPNHNHGEHIVSIIGRKTCEKHDAGLGEACYTIPSDISERVLLAICNQRAKKAGANGKISESSYQTKQKKFHRSKAS